MTEKTPSILSRWEISETDLTELVNENPSLRGILLGYVAEKKFHDSYLTHPDVSEKGKDDDHDRTKKGDRRIVYKGETFIFEVKSLQTNLVKNLGNESWSGKAQVDASDCRFVTLPNGDKVKTTCLLRGEFDILAVNCFAFGEKWQFAFALNEDLPQNSYKKYTEYQRQFLLPTLIKVEWPLQPPFVDDPFVLLERLLGKRARTS